MGNNLSGVLRLAPAAIGFVIIAFIAARGCTSGPFGRSQIITISPQEELQLGSEAYREVLSKERENIVTTGPAVAAVHEVGDRLRRAAEDPSIRHLLNINPDLKLEWEFNVVRSSQVNAFCLPGGKVVVYTGILPICRTEAGLAVVMGHEIGHALARHGAARMSQQQLVNIAQLAVASSLGNMEPRKQAMVMAALGMGAQVGVILPFSRTQETDADHIGIILMAAAGYDPTEASRFWLRMAEKTGHGNSSFLSTHPSDETRMRNLQQWAQTEAMSIYDRYPHAPHADQPLNQFAPSTPIPARRPNERPAPAKGKGWEIK